MSQITIPERSSSKRTASKMSSDFDEQLRKVQAEIVNDRKKIKAAGSFDSSYWKQQEELAGKQLLHNTIFKRKSVSNFIESGHGNEDDWKATDQARNIMEEHKATEIHMQLCKKQSNRMLVGPEDKEKGLRALLMKLYTTSTRGLGVVSEDTGVGKRDASLQSNFRQKLVEASKGPKHPNDPSWTLIWCPVTHQWHSPRHMRAAHIFPWSQGQDTMDQIFGRVSSDKPELFEPENGMMLLDEVEEMLDSGKIVIVPQVKDEASKQEINSWKSAQTKSYKIRVIEPKCKQMKEVYPYAQLNEGKQHATWAEALDGRELNFSSEHRPRARYLYWLYCVSMLKYFWHKEGAKGQTLSKELGKRYWGTDGAFMKRKMLLGFVEEMGHEYEWLLEGAIESGQDQKSDPIGLLAATDSIRDSASQRLREDDKEAEDDDDDEGEDDEGEDDESEDDEGGGR